MLDAVFGSSLIGDWNASHDEDVRVRPGDIICSINGSGCRGEEMLQLIQESGKGTKLKLHIQRPGIPCDCSAPDAVVPSACSPASWPATAGAVVSNL